MSYADDVRAGQLKIFTLLCIVSELNPMFSCILFGNK